MKPLFFLKIRKGKDYRFFNPVDNKECTIDYTVYRMLEQCDGANTLDDIISTVARDLGKTTADAADYVNTVLDKMHRTGTIAWGHEKTGSTENWPPPYTVSWDITEKCNLSCVHCCYPDERPHEKELTTEEIERAAEEMAAFGVERIGFSGGEPLLRKDFLEIVSYVGSLGFKSVSVATNGTLIDRDIAGQLKKANLAVQVSVDGDVCEIHDRIRATEGAFDGAIRGIRLLLEEGVNTSVCTTAMKLNVDRIPNIIQLMQDLGVKNYRVQGLMPVGRGKMNDKELKLEPARMKELVQYLEDRKIPVSSYNFTLKPPPADPVDFCASGACSAGRSKCSITSEGNVVPCTYFWGMNGENLRDHTFAWIWENSMLLNYFRGMLLDDIKGHCRDCKWLLLCNGGCKAENYGYGDIFASNRCCWVADEMRKSVSQVQDTKFNITL